MNNKGQSLVFFILILPIMILFLLFLIYTLSGTMNNNQNKDIINENISYILRNNINEEDKIREVMHNNLDYQELSFEVMDSQIGLTIKVKNDNIVKKNTVTYNYCGNYETKKIENKKCK